MTIERLWSVQLWKWICLDADMIHLGPLHITLVQFPFSYQLRIACNNKYIFSFKNQNKAKVCLSALRNLLLVFRALRLAELSIYVCLCFTGTINNWFMPSCPLSGLGSPLSRARHAKHRYIEHRTVAAADCSRRG